MSKTPPQWPFTPSLLDSIPEQVAQLFRELELYLLNEICSRIKATAQMNEVAVGAYRALRAHGIKTSDIDKEIQKRVQQAGVKFKDVMKDVVNWNQQYYTNTINAAGLTQPDSLVDESDIKVIEDQCYEQFSNLTRSMGFYYGGELLKNPGEVYQHVMDSAVLKIQSGATSYNEAIRSAIIELADGGLRAVDWESGHVDRIDVAVRRAVRTGSAQLNAKYREQGVDYLKTDLVEVTAHYGARDQGVGPENHESWQGKWYRWSEKPRTSKGNYPDFVTTTGYKTGEGLLGWNCRHSFYSVIEGVHMPTYTKEQLEAMKGKNRKKVKYQGKEYTDYEASQFQRKLERSIRKYLRRQNAAKAAGLDDDAAAFGARVQSLRRQYKEFSKAAGLPEQLERTHVYEEYKNSAGKVQDESGNVLPSGGDGGKIDTAGSENGLNQNNAEGHEDDEYSGEPQIPQDYDGNFEGLEELDFNKEEVALVRRLRDLADTNHYEYACHIVNGKLGEIYTDEVYDSVSLRDAPEGAVVLHSHTNCTPLSTKDIQLMVKCKLGGIGNTAKGGDVFLVSPDQYGLPTEDEFKDYIKMLDDNFAKEVLDMPGFFDKTPQERLYVLTYERMLNICRHFGFRLQGGRIS